LHSKCCLSREFGIPTCGAEARSEYVVAAGSRSGCCAVARERRKPESTIEQPSCEKEKRGERQFDFQPIGDSLLRRNNKKATA